MNISDFTGKKVVLVDPIPIYASKNRILVHQPTLIMADILSTVTRNIRVVQLKGCMNDNDAERVVSKNVYPDVDYILMSVVDHSAKTMSHIYKNFLSTTGAKVIVGGPAFVGDAENIKKAFRGALFFRDIETFLDIDKRVVEDLHTKALRFYRKLPGFGKDVDNVLFYSSNCKGVCTFCKKCSDPRPEYATPVEKLIKHINDNDFEYTDVVGASFTDYADWRELVEKTRTIYLSPYCRVAEIKKLIPYVESGRLTGVMAGVERVDQHGMRLFRKHNDMASLWRDTNRLLKVPDVEVMYNFIIGVPGETLNTLDENYRCMMEMMENDVDVSPAIYTPQTNGDLGISGWWKEMPMYFITDMDVLFQNFYDLPKSVLRRCGEVFNEVSRLSKYKGGLL